jgi:hypothetical protein
LVSVRRTAFLTSVLYYAAKEEHRGRKQRAEGGQGTIVAADGAVVAAERFFSHSSLFPDTLFTYSTSSALDWINRVCLANCESGIDLGGRSHLLGSYRHAEASSTG